MKLSKWMMSLWPYRRHVGAASGAGFSLDLGCLLLTLCQTIERVPVRILLLLLTLAATRC